MNKTAIRIQRKRTKGWKMPPNTVYVGRPTKFGNYVGLDKYEATIRHLIDNHYSGFNITELKGKNLACWCGLDQECHADILLKIANE